MSESLDQSLLQFPCRFPIKAMGKAADDFADLVISIVDRHAPGVDTTTVKVRESNGGKWLSVTVVIDARDKEQLDAIYRELSAHERIVWAL